MRFEQYLLRKKSRSLCEVEKSNRTIRVVAKNGKYLRFLGEDGQYHYCKSFSIREQDLKLKGIQ